MVQMLVQKPRLITTVPAFIALVLVSVVVTTACSSKSRSLEQVASLTGEFNLSGTWEWRARDGLPSGCLLRFWWENEIWNGWFSQDPNDSKSCEYLENKIDRIIVEGSRVTLWIKSESGSRFPRIRQLVAESPSLLREKISGWFYLQKRSDS